MTTTIKTISYAAIAALCMFALVVPQVFANHTWGSYHWARTTPSFTLQLVDTMSSQWTDSVQLAVSDWSASSVLNLALSQGSSKRGCRGQDGKVTACNASYGDVGWLGIAQIWTSGDHIVKGVVKMNDTYYNTSYYNTPAWRSLVVCQEIGHTFGLGHQDETFDNANLNTCMDYTNSPGSNQHPNVHDYALLETIYEHTDSFDSYAIADTGGGGKPDKGNGGGKGKPQAVGQDIDLNNPSAWGQVLKTDGQNNPSLYVRNIGNGQQLFTHVYWIEGEGEHAH